MENSQALLKRRIRVLKLLIDDLQLSLDKLGTTLEERCSLIIKVIELFSRA